jgi:cystathionine beta-synthase
VFVDPRETVANAVKLMRDRGLDHLLVSAAQPPVRLPEILGVLTGSGLAERLAHGPVGPGDEVAAHMSAPPPHVGVGQPAAEAAAVLGRADVAVVVDGGLPCGVVTARDLLSLLA